MRGFLPAFHSASRKWCSCVVYCEVVGNTLVLIPQATVSWHIVRNDWSYLPASAMLGTRNVHDSVCHLCGRGCKWNRGLQSHLCACNKRFSRVKWLLVALTLGSASVSSGVPVDVGPADSLVALERLRESSEVHRSRKWLRQSSECRRKVHWYWSPWLCIAVDYQTVFLRCRCQWSQLRGWVCVEPRWGYVLDWW